MLVEEIVPRHGRLWELLSDRGANFLLKLMEAVLKLLKIKKINMSAYHPQTNGLVEKFHRTLIDMLSKVVGDRPHDWDLYLPYILFAYRTTTQESTRATQFKMLYGREVEVHTSSIPTQSLERSVVHPDSYVDDIQERMTEAREAARLAIQNAQEKQ